jgi:hypothetical protein
MKMKMKIFAKESMISCVPLSFIARIAIIQSLLAGFVSKTLSKRDAENVEELKVWECSSMKFIKKSYERPYGEPYLFIYFCVLEFRSEGANERIFQFV